MKIIGNVELNSLSSVHNDTTSLSFTTGNLTTTINSAQQINSDDGSTLLGTRQNGGMCVVSSRPTFIDNLSSSWQSNSAWGSSGGLDTENNFYILNGVDASEITNIIGAYSDTRTATPILSKFNSSNQLEWSIKLVPDVLELNYAGTLFVDSSDVNKPIYVTFSSADKIFVFKLSNQGEILWQKQVTHSLSTGCGFQLFNNVPYVSPYGVMISMYECGRDHLFILDPATGDLVTSTINTISSTVDFASGAGDVHVFNPTSAINPISHELFILTSNQWSQCALTKFDNTLVYEWTVPIQSDSWALPVDPWRLDSSQIVFSELGDLYVVVGDETYDNGLMIAKINQTNGSVIESFTYTPFVEVDTPIEINELSCHSVSIQSNVMYITGSTHTSDWAIQRLFAVSIDLATNNVLNAKLFIANNGMFDGAWSSFINQSATYLCILGAVYGLTDIVNDDEIAAKSIAIKVPKNTLEFSSDFFTVESLPLVKSSGGLVNGPNTATYTPIFTPTFSALTLSPNWTVQREKSLLTAPIFDNSTEHNVTVAGSLDVEQRLTFNGSSGADGSVVMQVGDGIARWTVLDSLQNASSKFYTFDTGAVSGVAARLDQASLLQISNTA
jgi:hypothetical protein